MSPATTNGSASSNQQDLAQGSGPDEPPRKKQRKPRQHFSCAECRRLKLKCDRQVPCANCVRRSCGDRCPHGPRTGRVDAEASELRKRLNTLEGVLTNHGIPVPEPETDSRPQLPLNSSTMLPPTSRSAQAPRGTPSPNIRRLTSGSLPNQSEIAAASSAPNGEQPASGNGRTPGRIAATGPLEAGGPVIPQSEVNSVQFDFSTDNNDIAQFRSLPIMSPEEHSFGTLVISQGGRSKYLGPTAASEWLRDQETQEPHESPIDSRFPSPERREHALPPVPVNRGPVFPFDGSFIPIRTTTLLERLPPIDEASVLIDSYYRYFSWHFDVAPRRSFQAVFDRVYAAHAFKKDSAHRIDPQEMALVYIILAFGALHSLELPPNDPSADEYLALAKGSLAKGDFMTNTTIAGVQTLHIMAHFHLETERGRNGDSAWPLWGLAMRLMQAMGMHRDGAKWNLSEDVIEERRRVFWENTSADIFQANCFSRPSSIRPEYIDTELPADRSSIPGEKSFSTLKFELCRISGEILDLAMKVQAPPYSTVLNLNATVCEFEKNVPYYMRCRAALLALPSAYPEPNIAIQESPEVSKRNLALSFQQCTLAINISETILFLHRPYYAKALHEDVQDPTRSMFGASYLAVVERCNTIISIVASLHASHPNVASRHWFLWYHVFNCGVCMGTMILRNPHNALASFALSQIDTAINLYTSVVQIGTSTRLVKNLQWLLRLRSRAYAKFSRPAPADGRNQMTVDELSDDDEAIDLIGLRTRLIQRAGKGLQTATTISSTTPNNLLQTTPSPSAAVSKTISLALQQHFGGGGDKSHIPADQQSANSSNPMEMSTDQLLHQFWDPMMMQEIPESTWNSNVTGMNWWDWDKGTSGQSGPSGSSGL